MLFLKKDILSIVEIGEAFSSFSTKNLDEIYLKADLDFINFEFKEKKRLSLDDYIKRIEEIATNLSPFCKKERSKYKIGEEFYYEYLIGALFKDEKFENYIVEDFNERLMSLSTGTFEIEKHKNTLGFHEVLGIGFLGVITSNVKSSIYQIFDLDGNDIILKTISKDVNSKDVLIKVAEYFFGEENVVDLDDETVSKLKNLVRELRLMDDKNIKEIAYCFGEKYKFIKVI